MVEMGDAQPPPPIRPGDEARGSMEHRHRVGAAGDREDDLGVIGDAEPQRADRDRSRQSVDRVSHRAQARAG